MVIGQEEMQALEKEIIELKKQLATERKIVERILQDDEEKHFIRIPNGYKVARIELVPVEHVSIFGIDIEEKGESL